jgi:hypothetical protein
LRKNVSGTVVGLPFVSLTCEAKFVIWAMTRQGAVTGEIGARSASGTVSVLVAAAAIADRSARSSAVVLTLVLTLAAPVGVSTHQASAVRRTEVLMI